jgi:hypothetical protein
MKSRSGIFAVIRRRQGEFEWALGVVYPDLDNDSTKVPSIPLNIKDLATEKSVRELAALTGETVTNAVHRSCATR